MSGLVDALLTGDVAGCLERLSPGVVLTTDAGPLRRAARRRVVGADRVTRLLHNLSVRQAARVVSLRPVTVNGGVGLAIDHADGPMILTGDVDDSGRVVRIWIQMNPAKVPALGSGPAASS